MTKPSHIAVLESRIEAVLRRVSGETNAMQRRSPVQLAADSRWTEEIIQNVLKNCAGHSPDGREIYEKFILHETYRQLVRIILDRDWL